jgi:hypothetical protein
MDLEQEGVLEKDLDARYLPTLAALMIFGIEPLVKMWVQPTITDLN